MCQCHCSAWSVSFCKKHVFSTFCSETIVLENPTCMFYFRLQKKQKSVVVFFCLVTEESLFFPFGRFGDPIHSRQSFVAFEKSAQTTGSGEFSSKNTRTSKEEKAFMDQFSEIGSLPTAQCLQISAGRRQVILFFMQRFSFYFDFPGGIIKKEYECKK